jgi:beta-N-acetylhexosaminidase
MGAIQKYYDPAEAAITAILSGVDMIMLAEERYGEDVGDYVLSQNNMLDKVEQAVMEGRIPMKRIDEAYNRITELKKKYNLKEKIITDPEVAGSVVGSRENKEAAIRIAEAALYIAFDNKSSIPLKSGCSVSVVKLAKENLEEIIRISKGIGPNYYNAYSDFVREMKNAGFNVTEYSYDSKIPAGENIIAVSENYPLAGKSLDLMEQRKRLTILREGNRATLINVALKDPYDACLVKSDAYICAMGSNISNIKATVNLLSGKAVAKGKLPVTPVKE